MDEPINTLEVPTPEVGTEVVTTDEGYYIERGLIPPRLRSPNGNLGDVDRQEKAWAAYVQSWKDGSPSAYKAGIAAGYTPATAHNLSSFKWFKEKKDKLRRSKMMSNAERNLSRILNMDYKKMKLMPDGSMQESVDNDTLRIVADISKTIVTTLGKDVGYSTKTEVGGGMNSEISIKSVSYADPVQIEAVVVDEAVKQLEGTEQKLIETIIEEKNGDNTSSQVPSQTLPDTNS